MLWNNMIPDHSTTATSISRVEHRNFSATGAIFASPLLLPEEGLDVNGVDDRSLEIYPRRFPTTTASISSTTLTIVEISSHEQSGCLTIGFSIYWRKFGNIDVDVVIPISYLCSRHVPIASNTKIDQWWIFIVPSSTSDYFPKYRSRASYAHKR